MIIALLNYISYLKIKKLSNKVIQNDKICVSETLG